MIEHKNDFTYKLLKDYLSKTVYLFKMKNLVNTHGFHDHTQKKPHQTKTEQNPFQRMTENKA